MVLTLVYNIGITGFLGLCASEDILKMREHSVVEIGSLSFII
jgi:hypothetical protein